MPILSQRRPESSTRPVLGDPYLELIRIGYADERAERLTQVVLPALHRRQSQLTVEPQWMSSPNQIWASLERRLDLAWCWTPELAPGLRELPVAREAVVLVLSAEHELAAEPTVDPARLSGQRLVVVSRGRQPGVARQHRVSAPGPGCQDRVAHEVVGIERI